MDGWLKKYEAEGPPIQKRHLGHFVGLFLSGIGGLRGGVKAATQVSELRDYWRGILSATVVSGRGSAQLRS